MSKHLTDEQITRSLKRLDSPEAWSAADEHISQCPECRERLAKAWDFAAAFQRSPTAVPPTEIHQPASHLTFEQLEAYVDGKITAAEQKAVQLHAQRCPACAEELRDLEAFRKELADSGQDEKEGRQPWQAGPVLRWPVLLRVAAVAVVATSVATAAVVLLWMKKPHPGSASIAVNKPAGSTSNNGSPSVQKPEAFAAELASLQPDDQRAVRQAIDEGRIALPQNLSELRGSQQTLLGESPHGRQFRVLEPVGEAVVSSHPVFRWQRLSGAVSYSVVIFDTKLNPVQTSPALRDSSWSISHALKEGEVYEWQVTAKTEDGGSVIAPAPPSPEAKFLVLQKKKVDEIDDFQRVHPDDHLVLGILYAQAGAFLGAIGELKQISPNDPNYNVSQKLLAGVEELRRHD